MLAFTYKCMWGVNKYLEWYVAVKRPSASPSPFPPYFLSLLVSLTTLFPLFFLSPAPQGHPIERKVTDDVTLCSSASTQDDHSEVFIH